METTQVQERVGMPLAEFIAEYEQQPFELINGERIIKMPGVFSHIMMIRLLFRLLDHYAQAHQLGEVFQEATFILPNSDASDWVKGSRVPDILFISAAQMTAYLQQTQEIEGRPIALIPDLVIEVVSPNDSYSAIDAKVDLYLADGVQVVWICDPQRRKVRVHTLTGVMTLTGEMPLNGGDVLPGFEVALTEIFAAPTA